MKICFALPTLAQSKNTVCFTNFSPFDNNKLNKKKSCRINILQDFVYMVEKKSGQGKPCQSFLQLYVPFAPQNMDYAGSSPVGIS